MALENENGGLGTTMLVSPTGNISGAPYPVYYPAMGGGNGGGGNNGDGWGSGWWIILLFILLASGNWGGNNNGANGGMFGGGAPIVISDNNGGSVQRGFDQAAVMSGVNAIQNGISGLSTQMCNCCCDMQGTMNNGFSNVQQSLCSGFAGVNATVTGAQNALTQQMYTNQIADMERSYAAQTASTQGMTNIQSQLAQCCCDNRLATNDLKYVIATENCADRAAAAENTRDIIDSQTRGIQTIMDKLCQLELDGVRNQLAQAQRENTGLQNQLNMANLAASQIAQTAQIVDQTYNRLSTCPVGTVPVYGETPIFRCNNNNGCGCGCNGGNF